ncbi:hypothetical protein BaRGS_00023582 [Batillaria attramentaria]|uniref:Major facilitator superfamily (MFS) profile domain-containing protein n=1 Tax=Batillaria attramentaria TaxID=370345 RepID=A0ABD0KDP4_9CAEN
MKFDDVLRQIGEFGPYQKRVYFFASIPSVLIAFEALNVIFTFYIPPHRCAIPGYIGDTYKIQNETHARLVNLSIPRTNGVWDQCHVYRELSANVSFDVNVTGADAYLTGPNGSMSDAKGPDGVEQIACEKWVFDYSIFDSTIPDDMGVVCDNSWQRAASNMIAELGTCAGCFISGFFADRFGRKIPFYVGGLGLLAGGFGIAFTQSIITLNLCRFLMGIARMAVFVNGLVVGMEIVGPSRRVFTGVVIQLTWCLGEFLLLVFVYFIRDWRWLEIALSVPAISLMFYWWLLPESPRWLASRGREDEAIEVLKRIAKSNKTQLPEIEDAKELLESETTLGFRHALKSRELIIRILIVFSNMFVIAMVYYGMTLNITNLSGDVFVNFAISAAVETAGYACPIFILDRLGRKPVYCASILGAGIALVGSIVPVMLNAPEMVIVVLAMVGRFCVCVSYAVIYVFGAELFPTVVRASTMGVGVTFSRFGSVICPYIADVGILVGGRFQDALPLLLMGSPAFLVGLLSLWLPETKGTRLPDTLADVKNSEM